MAPAVIEQATSIAGMIQGGPFKAAAPGHAATGAAPSLPSTSQPMEFLSAILKKIASVDKEGYFQIPVDEKLHQAPNYYAIIKQPLCFQDMKQRLAAGVYTSFRQMREDFELICSNAKSFNKSTTKVFKAAGLLAQRGSKILKQYELDIRKAFSLLYPASGPSPAGAGMGGAYSAALTELNFSTASLGGREPSASMDAAGEDTSDGQGINAGFSVPTSPQRHLDQAIAEHAVPSTGHQRHQQTMHAASFPCRTAWCCTYISDEELETCEEGGREALDTVLQGVRTAAHYHRWHPIGQAASSQQQQSGAEGTAADVSDARPASSRHAEPSVRTSEWREQRRPVELQCRWVELRLLELKSQRQRLQQQLAALRQGMQCEQQQKGQVAPTGATSASGSHAAVQKEALCVSMECMSAAHGHVHGAAFFRLRAGTQPELKPLACRSSMQRLGDATDTEKLQQPAASSLPLASAPTDEKQAPAVLYTACDLLAEQLHNLRNQLMEIFPNLDRTRASLTYGYGAVLDGKGGAAGMSGRPAGGRRTSSARLLPGQVQGLNVLTRVDSSFKRKRSDAELDGLGSPAMRASIDRLPSTIFIPPVRELSEEEQQARLVASTTWNEEYHLHGEAALSEVPPDVGAVLFPEDEDTSSEDTSDEAYARMHDIMAEDEHRRYAAAVAEGQRKRANMGQGQAGLPAPAGTKAPRGQASASSLHTQASGHLQRAPSVGQSQSVLLQQGQRPSRGVPSLAADELRPSNGRRASELGLHTVKSVRIMDGGSPSAGLTHGNGGSFAGGLLPADAAAAGMAYSVGNGAPTRAEAWGADHSTTLGDSVHMVSRPGGGHGDLAAAGTVRRVSDQPPPAPGLQLTGARVGRKVGRPAAAARAMPAARRGSALGRPGGSIRGVTSKARRGSLSSSEIEEESDSEHAAEDQDDLSMETSSRSDVTGDGASSEASSSSEDSQALAVLAQRRRPLTHLAVPRLVVPMVPASSCMAPPPVVRSDGLL